MKGGTGFVKRHWLNFLAFSAPRNYAVTRRAFLIKPLFPEGHCAGISQRRVQALVIVKQKLIDPRVLALTARHR
jgi:hypothetical protein